VEPEQVGLRCANCGREPRPDENALGDWVFSSDALGERHAVCRECATRESTPQDPYLQLRRELVEQFDRDARPLWRRMLGF